MKIRLKFFLLTGSALVGLLLLFWIFNLCAYNFWLANQQIDRREVYEQHLYWSLAALLSLLAVEVFAIWQAAKTVKLLS